MKTSIEEIEQKAKAYDKAIKRAKRMFSEKELNYLFPELKESENEKVRKAIHIYLDWLDGRKDYAPKGEYSIKDMIAWLEKQGKQNLTSDNKRAWLYIVADVLTWKDGIGQYLDDPRVQKLANTFANTFTIYSNSSNIGKNK